MNKFLKIWLSAGISGQISEKSSGIILLKGQNTFKAALKPATTTQEVLYDP
jgi:hypothetical protein